ncbi:MAG: hypothetical protein VKN60_06865 [Cyanobacteriota bacterium]|nr:hypothetical protein [Cyanobacteriota bacterium]
MTSADSTPNCSADVQTIAKVPTTAPAPSTQTIGFLQESQGNNSSMRLMCLMALITAICFGGYTLVNSKQVGNVGTNLTFAFLAAAFGGKVAHKFAENQ